MTRKCSCFPSAYTAAAAAAGPPPIIIRSYIAILLTFYEQYSLSHSREGEEFVILYCRFTTRAAIATPVSVSGSTLVADRRLGDQRARPHPYPPTTVESPSYPGS